jgi:RNA polymerase sigma-70 factor (ECF subfamily)
MMEETNLLQEVSAGNEKAFKQLFELHYSKLYNYLLRVTKSKEIAEEIAIDIFVKLWVGREVLQDIRHLDAFLQKVAHNKALDFFKMAARNARLHKLIRKEMEAAREQEADHRLLDNEYQHLVSQAIDQLSPQRKMVFTMSRIEGLTHDEIANRLQLSRNTVRNTIAQSLKSIRQFLHNHDVSGAVILGILMNN